MLPNDLTLLERAAEARDLQTLDEFLFPKRRNLNASNRFHAPMMLSAHNVKHLSKIPKLAADCIILNLEDGVSPEQKPVALRLAALTLASFERSDTKLVVRINPLDEGGEEEIRVLNSFMPDAIRVPKIRNAEDVKRALELVAEPIELHLSVETREAWTNLAMLRTDARVSAFYLGILDLFADMGFDQGMIEPENPTLHYMLSHFLVTTRALGVKPVSFVYQDYRNDEGFETWLALEQRMGFDAKGCISPKQAEAAMRRFATDDTAVAKAREIVRLFEAQRDKGVTGFTHEQYGFIDEPIYKGALALLKGSE